MTALQEMVAAIDEVLEAGEAARRTGRDQQLSCAHCRVNANLATLDLDLGCTEHAPLLAAYREQRRP